jgi:hypothetical protein
VGGTRGGGVVVELFASESCDLSGGARGIDNGNVYLSSGLSSIRHRFLNSL